MWAEKNTCTSQKLISEVWFLFWIKKQVSYITKWCWKTAQNTVEPQFNEVLDITNKNLHPGQSYSKMYGIEPQYNKLFDVTNIICKPKHKIYLDITNYSVNTRQRINAEQIHDGKSGAVRKSDDSRVPSCQWRTHFWRCKPKDRGNLHWKNSFININCCWWNKSNHFEAVPLTPKLVQGLLGEWNARSGQTRHFNKRRFNKHKKCYFLIK